MIEAKHRDRLQSHILRKSGLLSLRNRLRFGSNAPTPGIKLQISPSLLSERYFESGNDKTPMPHWLTGQIQDGDWDLSRRDFTKSFKFTACRKHFIDGIAWDKTNVISHGLKRIEAQIKYDNCYNEADLIRRYKRLDDLWGKTRSAGALPPEVSHQANLRDSILVHMTRDGTLLFGNQGFHRLSIAKLANVETITVLLGVIHKQAVLSGAAAKTIASYRQR